MNQDSNQTERSGRRERRRGRSAKVETTENTEHKEREERQEKERDGKRRWATSQASQVGVCRFSPPCLPWATGVRRTPLQRPQAGCARIHSPASSQALLVNPLTLLCGSSASFASSAVKSASLLSALCDLCGLFPASYFGWVGSWPVKVPVTG